MKSNRAYLDSGAGLTMFCDKLQAASDTCNKRSNCRKAKFLGKATLKINNLEVEDSVHVENLHDTLVLVKYATNIELSYLRQMKLSF